MVPDTNSLPKMPNKSFGNKNDKIINGIDETKINLVD